MNLVLRSSSGDMHKPVYITDLMQTLSCSSAIETSVSHTSVLSSPLAVLIGLASKKKGLVKTYLQSKRWDIIPATLSHRRGEVWHAAFSSHEGQYPHLSSGNLEKGCLFLRSKDCLVLKLPD